MTNNNKEDLNEKIINNPNEDNRKYTKFLATFRFWTTFTYLSI